MEYVTLNDGNKMPKIGFGTYQITDLKECEKVVLEALDAGYRLIDTAQVYFNEEAVGNALSKTKVPRKEIFVTTKIWLTNYDYDATIESFKRSLKKLKTDYVDLVLIHQPFSNYYEAYRALADLKKQGLIKSIGVSNFYPDRLVDITLFNSAGIVPAVNQIEINPFFQQKEAIVVNNKYNIAVQAWAPFAEGKNNIFTNEVLAKIAKAHKKSVAQVILRFLLDKGISLTVKSVNKDRILENISIFDFKLTAKDISEIESLDTKQSLFFSHNTEKGPEIMSNFSKQKGKV